MKKYSEDVTYAYMQLGLEAGASSSAIQAVLDHAVSYRFFTKARLDYVRLYVEFFALRHRLGGIDKSFAEIKRSYHDMAKKLHPDRQGGDADSEEELKAINAAYALVEKINQEAKKYYAQSAEARREIEQEAREATLREMPMEAHQKRAAEEAAQTAKPKTHSLSRAGKYMAASVPRSIRTARLSHIPVQAIIGSRVVSKPNDINFVFDYFMLPEMQFMRAKSFLSVPETAMPSLQMLKFNPPYILKDTKEIIVPDGAADPESFARDYFKKEFGI